MVMEESRTETSSIAWVTGRHEAGDEGRRLSIKSFDDRFITLPGMSTHQPQNYTSFIANFHSINFLLKGETVIYVKGTPLSFDTHNFFFFLNIYFMFCGINTYLVIP